MNYLWSTQVESQECKFFNIRERFISLIILEHAQQYAQHTCVVRHIHSVGICFASILA